MEKEMAILSMLHFDIMFYGYIKYIPQRTLNVSLKPNLIGSTKFISYYALIRVRIPRVRTCF